MRDDAFRGLAKRILQRTVERNADPHIKPPTDEGQADLFARLLRQGHADAAGDALARLVHHERVVEVSREQAPLHFEPFRVRAELFAAAAGWALAAVPPAGPLDGFAARLRADAVALRDRLALPLLLRAEALLRLVVKQHRAEGRTLEWGWHENRPALSLLASLAFYHVEHDDPERAVDLLEWCVLTLNPNDNQGLRDPLIHHYLRVNRSDDALRLAARYPDDLPAMQYGGILALFMADKIEEATRQLKKSACAYPEIASMLLSAKPRRPALNAGFSTLGGKDEAWYYRENNLEIWQQSGGLAWLRQALPKLPAKNRK